MNTVMFRRVARQIVSEMKKAGFIENVFSKFMLRHPHYQKIGKDLRRGCELACSACALSAVLFSCRGSALAVRELIAAMRAEMRAVPRSKGNGDVAEILDYLEPLSYIHGHDSLKNRSADRMSCSLATIGLMAVTRVVEKHKANSLYKSETGHLLQELMLPLLATAFNQFANKQSSDLVSRYAGLCGEFYPAA